MKPELASEAPSPAETVASSNSDLDPDSGARRAGGVALRKLGHAIVGHEVSDEVFAEIVGFVDSVLPRIEAGPSQTRAMADGSRPRFVAPVDGALIERGPNSPVSGPGNPLGIAITGRRDGDEAVASAYLGAAFEGAPGRAHGGIVASIFDDVMGFVLTLLETPAFTGSLTVKYLAPTPLHVDLEFRGRLRERDGRKLWIEAEATCNGERFAEAEGLFISVPLEVMIQQSK